MLVGRPLGCSKWRTAEVQVLNPGVCRLPAWSQATCAWRTVCGLFNMTGSIAAQFQTCWIPFAGAAAVSGDKLCWRLQTGRDRWALWAYDMLLVGRCLDIVYDVKQSGDLVRKPTGTGWSLYRAHQVRFRCDVSVPASPELWRLSTVWRCTLCLKKKGPTLKRYSSKLYGSILMIFGRNIQKSLE